MQRSAYEHLIDAMPGNDPDDHEHMAAAIAGGAKNIVTGNKRDFPARALARHQVTVMDPDTYLCQLVDDLPVEVAGTLRRLASEKRRPPKSPQDLIDDLERAGVKRAAGKLREIVTVRNR